MLLSTETGSTLGMLLKKNQYTVAITPGQTQQADALSYFKSAKKIWGLST